MQGLMKSPRRVRARAEFKILLHLTFFYEIRYQRNATVGYQNVTGFISLQPAI